MSSGLERMRDDFDRRVAVVDADVPDEGEASDRNGDERQFCDSCGQLALTVLTSDLGHLCDECRKSVVEPTRKLRLIAISNTEGNTVIVAVGEDGSIWTLNTAAEVPQWFRLPSIP